MTDTDYIDDLAHLINIPAQAKSRLNSQGQAADSIAPYVKEVKQSSWAKMSPLHF